MNVNTPLQSWDLISVDLTLLCVLNDTTCSTSLLSLSWCCALQWAFGMDLRVQGDPSAALNLKPLTSVAIMLTLYLTGRIFINICDSLFEDQKAL